MHRVCVDYGNPGSYPMKQDGHADEPAQYWTLSPEERELLGNKTGAARLSFAVLLKAFQFDGRFPDHREDVAGSIVVHLAARPACRPRPAPRRIGANGPNAASALGFANTVVSASSVPRMNPPWSRG